MKVSGDDRSQTCEVPQHLRKDLTLSRLTSIILVDSNLLKDHLFRFPSPKSEIAGLEKHDSSFGCGPVQSVEQLDARMWPRSLSFCPRMSRGATTKLGTLGNFGAVLCTCDTDYSCRNIYSRYFLSRQNAVTHQVCANSATACRGRTVFHFGENKKRVIYRCRMFSIYRYVNSQRKDHALLFLLPPIQYEM